MGAIKSKVGKVVSTSTGPTFESIPVRIDSGKKVRPGQLVYAILQGLGVNDEVTCVMRVSTAREENPYEDPESSQIKDILSIQTEPYDSEQIRKYVIAETSFLEVIMRDGNRLRSDTPSIIIPSGTEVYDDLDPDTAQAVLGFPDPSDSTSLKIGKVVGSESNIVALDANKVLPRHLLIVGSTGTGKSWLLGKVTEQIHEKGLRIVNIDIHGELNAATVELGGEVVVPGKELKIQLSSLEEPEILGMIPVNNELHIDIVSKSIINLKTTGKAFNVDDLLSEALKVANTYGVKKSTLDIITARIKQLNYVPFLGPGFNWKEKLSKEGAVINVDCRSLPYTQLQTVVAAIARDLYNNRKRESIEPIELGIDEAHLFIPSTERAETTTILSQLIRMGRHVSMGLILISQSPSDLDRRVTKITNTRFIFAIEPSELNSISGYLADAPPELVSGIPRMKSGTCLLVGNRETVKHATVVEVGGRTTTHGGVTPKML